MDVSHYQHVYADVISTYDNYGTVTLPTSTSILSHGVFLTSKSISDAVKMEDASYHLLIYSFIHSLIHQISFFSLLFSPSSLLLLLFLDGAMPVDIYSQAIRKLHISVLPDYLPCRSEEREKVKHYHTLIQYLNYS